MKENINGNMQTDILNDFHYRNNSQEGLRIQIRSDYSLCRQLWDIAEKRTLTELEIDLLKKSFSWLKKSLKEYRKIQTEKLQGRIDGDLLDIQKVILSKNQSLDLLSQNKRLKD